MRFDCSELYMVHFIYVLHNCVIYTFYYTSEEFFLYRITVDKLTIHHFSRQNELLTGT